MDNPEENTLEEAIHIEEDAETGQGENPQQEMDEAGDATPSKKSFSFNLSAKIYSLVGLCLFMMACVGGVSIYQMHKIGQEIESIAERDLPLTGALTEITVHQLEQTIYFERAMRAAEEVRIHPEAIKTYKASVKKFEKYAKLVGKEFKSTENLAQKSYETAITQVEKDKFLKVKNDLIKLEETYHLFQKHTHEVFDMVDNGQLEASLLKLPVIEKEADKIDRTLENLVFDIEKFTEKAAIEAEHHEKAALKLLIAIMIVALLISAVAAYLLVKKVITLPLTSIKNGLDALNAGDYETDVKVYYNDEIGIVARSFGMMKQAARERAEVRQAELEKTKAEAERRAKKQKVVQSFTGEIEHIINSVSAASTELNATAQAMTEISSRTSTKSSSVSQASNSASDNVKTVADASEKMSSSISEISAQVQQASAATEKTSIQVAKTSEQIGLLATTAEKIDTFINLVSDIAEQTNLLALNATIESARAGEAGKGFSVVASEVKELANQTSKATVEISEQVKEIQAATNGAVSSMADISTAIGELEGISSSIAGAMNEQGNSTREIAQSVNTAAAGTQEVSENIEEISEASKETEAASGEVLYAAGELSKQSEVLKTVIDKFLHEVEAA